MRLFEERVGVSRSYIHGIEQGKLLPSREKLEHLASVFVAIAKEQEAADPEADARRLYDERERTALVDRFELDPRLADAFVSLRSLTAKQRAAIAGPLAEALDFFATLDVKERQGLGPFIRETTDFLDSLDSTRRLNAVVAIVNAVNEVRKSFEAGNDPATLAPPGEPVEQVAAPGRKG